MTLGDFGEPEDIAEAAAFLASTKARWVGTWDVNFSSRLDVGNVNIY